MWTCPRCSAEVDEGFDLCWHCGTVVDGVENPDFVREIDVGVMPAGWVPRIRCGACGYEGKVLVGHHGYQLWMLPLAILFSCSLVGVIPWFVLFLLLGNRTFRGCPQCARRNQLRDWDRDPTAEAEIVWQTARKADDAAFRRNKNALLTVTLVVLALSLALLFSTWAAR
jgi:hypothetical protein